MRGPEGELYRGHDRRGTTTRRPVWRLKVGGAALAVALGTALGFATSSWRAAALVCVAVGLPSAGLDMGRWKVLESADGARRAARALVLSTGGLLALLAETGVVAGAILSGMALALSLLHAVPATGPSADADVDHHLTLWHVMAIPVGLASVGSVLLVLPPVPRILAAVLAGLALIISVTLLPLASRRRAHHGDEGQDAGRSDVIPLLTALATVLVVLEFWTPSSASGGVAVGTAATALLLLAWLPRLRASYEVLTAAPLKAERDRQFRAVTASRRHQAVTSASTSLTSQQRHDLAGHMMSIRYARQLLREDGAPLDAATSRELESLIDRQLDEAQTVLGALDREDTIDIGSLVRPLLNDLRGRGRTPELTDDGAAVSGRPLQIAAAVKMALHTLPAAGEDGPSTVEIRTDEGLAVVQIKSITPAAAHFVRAPLAALLAEAGGEVAFDQADQTLTLTLPAADTGHDRETRRPRPVGT